MIRKSNYSKKQSLGSRPKVTGRLWLSSAVVSDCYSSCVALLNELAAMLKVTTDWLVAKCQKAAGRSKSHFEKRIACLARLGVKHGLDIHVYTLAGRLKRSIQVYCMSS